MANGNRPTPEFRREAARLALTSEDVVARVGQTVILGEINGEKSLSCYETHLDMMSAC